LVIVAALTLRGAALHSEVERSGGPPGGHHLGPPGRAAHAGAQRPQPRLGQIAGERPARRRAGPLPARVRPGRSWPKVAISCSTVVLPEPDGRRWRRVHSGRWPGSPPGNVCAGGSPG